jgi:hypothetical protein
MQGNLASVFSFFRQDVTSFVICIRICIRWLYTYNTWIKFYASP